MTENKPKPIDLENLEKVRMWNNRIIKACEFFLRYKDNPELLIKEHPEFKEEVERIKNRYFGYLETLKKNYPEPVKIENDCITIITGLIKEEISISRAYLTDYNEWLFKLAFKGVLNE